MTDDSKFLSFEVIFEYFTTEDPSVAEVIVSNRLRFLIFIQSDNLAIFAACSMLYLYVHMTPMKQQSRRI